METGSNQPVIGSVSSRNETVVEIRPPLRTVEALIKAPYLESRRIGQVGEARAGKLELGDQRGVLNEPLIVFGPRGRQLPRGIDRRNTDRVPATTKAPSPLPRQWQIRPSRNVGSPENDRLGVDRLRHRRPSEQPPDRQGPDRICLVRPDRRRSCRPSQGSAGA